MSLHVPVLDSLLNVVHREGAAANVKMKRRKEGESEQRDSWDISVSLSSLLTNDPSTQIDLQET